MPPVTRSKKHAVNDLDHLSGLMTSMKLSPKSTRKHKIPRVKKEKDISDIFSSLTLGTKSKRRRKGVRLTHKKTHKKTVHATENAPEDIDMSEILLGGKRRRKTRRINRSRF